jgi:hypothetical protein
MNAFNMEVTTPLNAYEDNYHHPPIPGRRQKAKDMVWFNYISLNYDTCSINTAIHVS